jgi:hypothetical protein
MSTDIIAPRFEFTDGFRFLPLPDLERLAQEELPTDEQWAAIDAARERGEGP